MVFSSISTDSCERIEDLSHLEVAGIVQRALLLQQAAEIGPGTHGLRGLRGKNLGLICDSADSEDAVLFRRAATEMGARVAHIRPGLGSAGKGEEMLNTARLLGRLYDAIECQGVASALIKEIRLAAGAPVYDGLALHTHATAQLVDRLDDRASLADRRRWLIQAVLLGSIG